MRKMLEQFAGFLVDHPVVILLTYLLSSFFSMLYFRVLL